MPISIPCPFCGVLLSLPDSAFGAVAQCRSCRKHFNAPRLQPVLNAEPVAPRSRHGPAVDDDVSWRSSRGGEVRVSARVLKWPPFCVCCCAPADHAREVAYVRRVGVQVIHLESKSWDVPYCHRCADHQKANWIARQAQGQHDSASANRLLFLLGVVVAIGGAVFSACGLLATQEPGMFLFIVMCSVFSACCGIGLWYNHQRLPELERAKTKASRRARELLLDDCATEEDAVEYLGWDGTIHTFHFRSVRYAALFRQANASKLV